MDTDLGFRESEWWSECDMSRVLFLDFGCSGWSFFRSDGVGRYCVACLVGIHGFWRGEMGTESERGWAETREGHTVCVGVGTVVIVTSAIIVYGNCTVYILSRLME